MDILPLLVGAIVTDTIIIFMNYYSIIFRSKELTLWYQSYRISAMLMDCIIIVLYALAGHFVAQQFGLNEIACILGVQLVGDIVFYGFFQALPPDTRVFNTFKRYAKEVKYHALWADAVMMLMTYGIAKGLEQTGVKNQQVLGLVAVYISQYILHLK